MKPGKQHKKPWLIGKLENYFYWHGQKVAKQPLVFVPICVALCGFLSIGLLNFTTEVNPYKLWIPSKSDFVRNTDWLWKNFPPDTRYHSVIVTADNVLKPDVLMHVAEIHRVIAGVQSAEGRTWEKQCYKIPVVDLRGDDVSKETPPEDLLSFDGKADQAPLEYDIYDYLSLYDSQDVAQRRRRSTNATSNDDPSIQLYPQDYCDIVTEITVPTCLEMGIAEMWAKNGFTSDEALEGIQRLTAEDIINAINNDNYSEVFLLNKNFTKFLGGIERNSTGHIIGAKATVIQFYGKIELDSVTEEDKKSNSYGAPVDKGTLEFEEALLEDLLNFVSTANANTSAIQTFVNVARSFDDLANEAIGADIPRIVGGVLIVYTYVLVMLGGFDCVQQKPFLGGIGLLCVFLAIVSSYGICSAVGLPFSPMHNIIPFLLMGIGIDDMFVIVQSQVNLESNDPTWKSRPVHELVGETLKHAGVAITITSVTDLLVFLIGATTVLPALQSFCIYCALGVLIVYLLQTVLFTAFLSLDIKRIRENKNGFLPCISHQMEEGNRPNAEPEQKKEVAWWRLNPGRVIFKKYATLLMHPVSKSIALLITAIMLGVGIYGVYELRQEFNPAWFLPAGSYLLDWYEKVDEFFPGSGERVTINIGAINYRDELWKVEALVRDLENQKDIVTSVDSWFSQFRNYVEQNHLVRDILDIDNVTDQALSYRLTQFLYSSSGAQYRKNFHFESSLICGLESPRIKLSTIEFTHRIFSGPSEHLPAMNKIKQLVKAYNFSSKAFAVGNNYAGWEIDEIIQWETYQNVGLSLIGVFVATIFVLVHFKSCVMVFVCVLMTLVNVGGFMHLWGLTINVTTCVTLVIAVGLCIDQAAHVAHTFLVTHEADANRRAILTLTEIGTPVMNGGVSTFLAFVITASSESHVFLTFFKIFTLVVTFGLFHGLVFLPIMLSFLHQISNPCSRTQPSEESNANAVSQTRRNFQQALKSGVINDAFGIADTKS